MILDCETCLLRGIMEVNLVNEIKALALKVNRTEMLRLATRHCNRCMVFCPFAWMQSTHCLHCITTKCSGFSKLCIIIAQFQSLAETGHFYLGVLFFNSCCLWCVCVFIAVDS